MKRNLFIVLVVAMIQLVFMFSSFASPIHIAVMHGKIEEVLLLLEEDPARREAIAENGCTPVHFAALCGQTSIFQVLMAAGSSVNSTSTGGFTPLDYAAENGHTEIVQGLVANGAKTNRVNPFGKTPLELAEKCGHAATVAALQPAAVAQTHTTEASRWIGLGKYALAARSHRWAAEALPGTDAAKVSYIKAAESHLESEDVQAAIESYTLAGMSRFDIHSLMSEYLSTIPDGLGSEAVADRHVRGMLSHLSAADIHHAGGNNAGVESALAAAELSRAQAMVSYDQAAVNADEEIQRTEKILEAKLALANHATANGNHALARKVLRERTRSLVLNAAQVVRACRIGFKLNSVESQHLERLARLGS